ncbi:MAG: sucrase ferredoxin [Vulcanimicrobiota bacterium]
MTCPSFPGCALTPLEGSSIVGTAPTEEAYLLLELPKPWPAKIKKMEGLVQELRPILKKHKGLDAKILGTPGVDWLEPCQSPRALLIRWNGRQTVYQTFPANREELVQALHSPLPEEPLNCYMVCTHGSRDPCCGLLGVPVFQTLRAHGSRRTLQVSHLGGHRFAPVVAVFPEWKFYGRLKPEEYLEMDQTLAKGQPFSRGYRGSGRWKSSLQVVEAKLWEEYGQAPLQLRRLSGDKENLVVEADFPDGRTEQFQARLETLFYQGYASCKDHRKGKEETLKLSVLKSLALSGR